MKNKNKDYKGSSCKKSFLKKTILLINHQFSLDLMIFQMVKFAFIDTVNPVRHCYCSISSPLPPRIKKKRKRESPEQNDTLCASSFFL